MIQIFLKGGPVMWPLLVTSIVALSVVIERVIFTVRVQLHRQPEAVAEIFREAENGNFAAAENAGRRSRDFVARTLTFALANRDLSFSSALLQAAERELQRFNRGVAVLDTVITLAPLLGLFGTVTGMIRAFGLLGASELSAPTQITGGIAEALIATAFGLLIAIIALLPFNFLNARVEQARHEIETSAAQLEMLLRRTDKETALPR
ncbi:MAG TPA: MotA/TolQ/ExbB proton channel family protein [Chthoniobacteraceae bacterium]|nr:MotA/TolQ/ExbB proton channel family protein [Chthoniobacteraceae bacterium]